MDFAARSDDSDLMTVASRYSQWRYGKADPDPQVGASLIADIQRLTGKIKQRPQS
ncbi:MAG: hypothetical protein ACK46K_04080 [Gammaproteobacteria bacterium]|jgi:pyrimidine deaminase RibD-like protein|nr:hypothetical protein [Xanthomonadaceae bacterium]